MHDVTELLFESPSKTHLWVNQKARSSIDDYADGPFLMKLERCCNNGFENYERSKNPPIRYEWDGVYRIGFLSSLFRLIGFYQDGTAKEHFVCLDAFEKSGQKLNAAERTRINDVARIKKNAEWRKSPDERFPRLAEGT